MPKLLKAGFMQRFKFIKNLRETEHKNKLQEAENATIMEEDSKAITIDEDQEVDSVTKGTLKGADGALVVAGGISAASTVTGIVGSSAATGGTVTGVFTYTVVDAGLEG